MPSAVATAPVPSVRVSEITSFAKYIFRSLEEFTYIFVGFYLLRLKNIVKIVYFYVRCCSMCKLLRVRNKIHRMNQKFAEAKQEIPINGIR